MDGIPLPVSGLNLLPPGLDDLDEYRKAAYVFLARSEHRPDFTEELREALVFLFANPTGFTRRPIREWSEPLLRVGWMGYALTVSEDWSGLDQDHSAALLSAADAEVLARMRAAEWPEAAFPWHDRVAGHVKGLVAEYAPYDAARAYLRSFPAWHRVASFAAWAVVPAISETRIPRRKAGRWQEAAEYAWAAGSTIGVLDLLGLLRPGFARTAT